MPALEVVDREAHAQYLAAIDVHLRDYYGRQLGHTEEHVAASIAKRIRRDRGEGLASMLEEFVGLEGKRLLDVGCGWGELVLSCLAHGADARGVEPDRHEIDISRLLLRSYGYERSIEFGVGESLPYGDESFDVVTCQKVLEHVDDIGLVVDEMIRVTRPGGKILVSVPNYLFPYEGHYAIKWFPLTPKWIGKYVLRAKGRDPAFLLAQVNYTTYPRMMRLWRSRQLEVRNLTRELVLAGRRDSGLYRKGVVRALILRLNMYPNVTWLLTKP